MANKPLQDMTQGDVEEILGPGTRADPADPTWLSRQWLCSSCGNTVETDEPSPLPAKCPRCGCIGFEKVTVPLH
jgi:rubrerythrin